MKENHLLYACILLLIFFTGSFTWPLQTVRITSTFGESRSDHLHDGIDAVSYDKRIYPVDDSILLYAWNRSFFPFDNYPGGGNYKILTHSEYASIYFHLADSATISPSYSRDQPIGHFCNTGRSFGAHLHFGLYERATFNSINFLNHVDLPDSDIPPIVDHMAFYINDTYVRIRNNATVRLTEHRPLLVSVYDMMHPGDRLGIYAVRFHANGEKIREFQIDGAVMEKNSLTVSGIPFESLYHGRYLQFPGITYREGINSFTIVLYDHSGNMTEEELILNITLDL